MSKEIFGVLMLVLLILIETNFLYDTIRTKRYHRRATISYARIPIMYTIIMYKLVYKQKIYLSEISESAERLKVDAYDLHMFYMANKHIYLPDYVTAFERYRDSNFDLDRVKKMNTNRFYEKFIKKLDLYEELKELYFKEEEKKQQFRDKQGV